MFFFFNTAVNVYDLKAFRNKDMPRKRISFIFDHRDMLLSLQIGFKFVRVGVACALLETCSGFELLSETISPRYLKRVLIPNFCLSNLTFF